MAFRFGSNADYEVEIAKQSLGLNSLNQNVSLSKSQYEVAQKALSSYKPSWYSVAMNEVGAPIQTVEGGRSYASFSDGNRMDITGRTVNAAQIEAEYNAPRISKEIGDLSNAVGSSLSAYSKNISDFSKAQVGYDELKREYDSFRTNAPQTTPKPVEQVTPQKDFLSKLARSAKKGSSVTSPTSGTLGSPNINSNNLLGD